MDSLKTPFVKPAASHKTYDICVISAANEHQARGYWEQLRWRANKGLLPAETEFLVFADPQGKRIGSGGSTIYVLYKLLEHFCRIDNVRCVSSTSLSSPRELFRGKRILVLHSGGDSRRLPAYSAVGKIFTPLPTDFPSILERSGKTGGFVTLFDLFFNNLMQLPCSDDGQVIVTSGDVLLSFDTSRIAFDDSGVTGLAYPGPVDIASNHGVYITPQTLSGESLRKVADFLQKPTYDELKKCDALDAANRAFIDTGIMNFAIDAIEVLMDASGICLEDRKVVVGKGSLCEDLINANIQLGIYKEFPFAMLGKLESVSPPIHPSINLLQQISFSVYLLPYCEFFHIGTSKQLLQDFHTINYTASIYGFQNFDKTKIIDKSGLGNAFVYNSLINTTAIEVNGPVFIEGCHLEGDILLHGENILTGIPEHAGNIKLQERICVTCIPISELEYAATRLSKGEKGWVSIIYGIEDDFKRLAEDDAATFLNDTFLNWMEDKGIAPNDLWEDNEPHELWSARLFPFSRDSAESVQISLSFQVDRILTGQNEENFQLDNWRKSYRMSLREILQSVDYERALDNYSNRYREVNLHNLAGILATNSDLSSEEILSWCAEENDYNTAAKMTSDLIEQSEDILFQARLYKLLSNILRKARDSGCLILDARHSTPESIIRYEDMAFELVREAIGKGLKSESIDRSRYSSTDLRIQIRSDEVVWVCAPTRLDFAGGWSDTPPYCLEHGGSVLNVAVKLNGQYPIQVIGKLHPEPTFNINSIDLGERIVISETSEMLSFSDPSDWCSLPKAAFITAGIIPEDTELDVQDILKQFGGGIDLTLFSAVPAGSGLGTSSILGSAIIACLSRMFGQELTQEDLFNRTLYMEQLMTTGGGWQDQIGGVVGGVKHIQTESGLFQIPRISWTDLRAKSNLDLSERFMLYYTGLRRMAKNILHSIVGRYLDRDPVTLETIHQLCQKSYEMKEQLDHRDIDAFGENIGEVWELNKTLDPGTSNKQIEAILSAIDDLTYGGKLLGAGGGGFLFMVTKGTGEARKIRQILTDDPPNNRARFFDFDVDGEGLKVSVL